MVEVKASKKATPAEEANPCEDLPPKRPSRGHAETQHYHPESSNSNVRGFNKFPAWYVDPLRGKKHVESLNGKLSCIPLIPWECPPEFALDNIWFVATGEESEEVKVQNDRETKVVEEVHAELSETPSSPSISLNEEDHFYDDSHIPIVPIIPIEEVVSAAETLLSDFSAPLDSSISSSPLYLCEGSSTSATRSPSICADLLIKSQGPSLIRHSYDPTAPYLPEQNENSLPQSVPQFPSTAATPKGSQPTMDLQALSVSQQQFSATSDISQSLKHSQLPSKFRASSKSADLSVKTQPPLTSISTSLIVPSPDPLALQKPPAGGDPSTFNFLDSDMVDVVTAAVTTILRREEQGSLIDTDLLLEILGDSEIIEKLMNENELSANTRTETTTACDVVPSSVPLPGSRTDSPVDKATNVHNDSPYSARSRSVIASQQRPLPSSKTEVLVIQSVQEHKTETISNAEHAGSHSLFHSTISGQVDAQSFFSSNAEELTIKSVGTLARTAPVKGSNAAAIPALMACPEHGASSIQNPCSSENLIRPLGRTQVTCWRPDMSSEFHAVASSKIGVAGYNWVEEKGASHVMPTGYNPKPMENSVTLPSSKPEVCLGKIPNAPAHIHGISPLSPLMPSSSITNVERIKELINKYGGHENTMPTTFPPSEPQIGFFPRARSDMVGWPGATIYTMANAQQPNLLNISHPPCPANALPIPSNFSAPPLDDVNCYTPLIMHHGERHENLARYHSHDGKPHNELQGPQLEQDLKSGEHNARQKKPCKFFHTPRGCRNGSNCSYLHDTSYEIRPGSEMETFGAKRVKK